MVTDGLVEEVRALAALPRPLSREAAQAVGYKELLDHLAGREGLDRALERIRVRSRQFAKRQRTWFRSLSGCRAARPALTFHLWGLKIPWGDTFLGNRFPRSEPAML